jgi:hypothetical protein
MSERFKLASNVPIQYFCAKCRCYHRAVERVAYEDTDGAFWCEFSVEIETQTIWDQIREKWMGKKMTKAEKKAAKRATAKPRLVYSSAKDVVIYKPKEPEKKAPPAELNLILG